MVNLSKFVRFLRGAFVQLENYAKIEEAKVEKLIKAFVDFGAKVIVSGVIAKNEFTCDCYSEVASNSW